MNFQDILNKPAAEVKPPKPLPMGTYLCLVDGQPEIKQMGKEQNYGAIFRFKPIQAGPDVSQAELLETLEGKPLSEVPLQTTFWLTDKAAYRLKGFLVDALGIDEGTRTLGELVPESQGKQVNVQITHRPSDDGRTMYMDMKSFARV